VVWATGFRPTYRWLDPHALGRRGRVDHDGGVASLPGLYLLGLPFLRRRRGRTRSAPGRVPGVRRAGAQPDVTLTPGSARPEERTSGPQHDVFDRTGGAGCQ
jgi:hypothetical protein